MKIGEALRASAALGLERLDAQVLMLHVLRREATDRAWLLAHDTDPLHAEDHARYVELCRRRAAGEPVAYLVGRKEFFGMDLLVDKRVLVPRPDTETLVQWALELLPVDGESRVIDLGTGSGAIALALKKSRPRARMEAVDRSEDALAVARSNAALHSLDVGFRMADWLAGADGGYDLVVSNPPYIAGNDPHLAALGSEPAQALVSGADGLDDLRNIVAQAPSCLSRGGWLLLEHGYGQAGAVRALLGAAGFASVATRLDLAGNERCSGGQWLELG
ncbi:MAG TPA: peptide chain release factor N(5)-glutamine methyltransferase [Ramlibacter sp.]|nr:peptide chain release factor N(5)-glutamine methyltransferase [Ramlibacter sp.]